MVTLFETQRLVFRPYQASDLQKLSALLADLEVMQFYPEPYSLERSEKLLCAIQDMMERVGYSFNAVYDRATDEYIGSLGLSQPRFALGFGRFVEIGWVFHKHYWGRGLASEGVILPFLGVFETGTHAAICPVWCWFSFMAGVMPPMAILGRSLLYVHSQFVAWFCTSSIV